MLHGRGKQEECRLLMAKAFRNQPDGSQVISAWKREEIEKCNRFRMMVLNFLAISIQQNYVSFNFVKGYLVFVEIILHDVNVYLTML
jgi:hypothetical protein